jgi:uncharacterized protein (TIGR01777 family)
MVNISMARVLVTGASGPIGAALRPSLKAAGARITRLVHTGSADGQATDEERIPWDPGKPISPQSVTGFEAVIHLAGETIMGRWTDQKKARIRDSRVTGTRHLAEALAQAKDKPQVFVCSSAVGYYGSRGDEILRERSAPGSGFLADVCRDWEAATEPAMAAGIRTVQMRTGIVLSPDGGALSKMLMPFKLGAGGRIGDGRQWMSWIDAQDMVGAIHHILRTDLVQGPVNMVAPKPVTNAEFTRTLAKVLNRPAVLPMPEFAVKLAFGEMGEALLLASQRVEPAQLVTSGYPFRFSELEICLENAVKR